jgi:cytochrome c oxidase subunit 7c
MLARATRTSAAAAAQQLVARRAFTTTRARLSSPYHYPEGPLSNIPFNPRKKGFALGYWSYCVVGFFLPFGIAGT